MAWKRIGNNRYFYRSRREGGKVVSEYFGRGSSGSLMAEIIRIETMERMAERELEKDEREEALEEDRGIVEWFDRVEAVADGAMLAAGFHKHHGQWRRKRDGGNERIGGEPSRNGGGQSPGETDLG